jgi:pimeloyl-ACP methyl ester carboxylesterase
VAERELVVDRGYVRLAGTLWSPAEAPPVATLLMHPGSGPSNRHNDVFFPPIREHLLAEGIAVCSFDKRGVGGSTGRWEEAAIAEQADDLLACVGAVEADGPGGPIGIYGHSQGGWVVIEAAGREPPIAFAVTSSGPGVTPAEQERYSTLRALERAAVSPELVVEALRGFDAVIEMLRARVPLEEARARVGEAALDEVFTQIELPLLPEEPDEWSLLAALIDYDPRPSLERIRVPLLAVFGADDRVVPVERSVTVYRETVRPDLLTVAVFPGADHRVQVGDRLADDYVTMVSSFIAQAAA